MAKLNARKTAELAKLLAAGNRLLALPDKSAEFRWGVIAMLEGTLHDTSSYRGFNYNATEFAADGEPTMTLSSLRRGYDETRRHYFAVN
jgi:hypothetical protein